MMNISIDPVYVPIKYKNGEPARHGGKVVFMYCVSPSKRECRERAAELMGTGRTWKSLAKEGWRIVEVEIVADEREVHPDQDFDP